jgi:hypothetical protein
MDKKGHHGVLLTDWQPHGIIAIFQVVQVYTVYSKCGIQCCTLQINYSCINMVKCTRYNVYQLLAHGRWFSPDTPTSSTTKTVRHDIVDILLKVALKHQKLNQSEKTNTERSQINNAFHHIML